MIGHILGKTLINVNYHAFYKEILSFEGVEFYPIPIPTEGDIKSVSYWLKHTTDFLPIINYDDDRVIDENGNSRPDQLYVLDEDGTLNYKERKDLPTYERKIDYRVKKEKEKLTLFILGQNKSSEHIFKELDDYKKTYHPSLEYYHYDNLQDVETIVKNINNVKGLRRILILSNENDAEDKEDLNIFTFFLSLRLDYKLDDDVEIYTEIDNPVNLEALKNMGVAQCVITNKMVSLFTLQLLMHANSRRFFTDILTNNTDKNDGVIDFDIQPADMFIDVSTPLEFECKRELVWVFYESSKHERMVIGYKNKDDKKITYLCSDMDKKEKIIIDENTVLVTAEFAEEVL